MSPFQPSPFQPSHFQRIEQLIRQGRLPEAKRLQTVELDRVLPEDLDDDEPVNGPAFVDLLRAAVRIEQARGVLN